MRRLLRIAIETPTMSRAVTMIWKVSDLKTRPNWSSRDEAKLDGYSLQQFHKFGLEKVAPADRFERLLKDNMSCLLYTSDAADDLLCVDLGGRRIIKKKKIKIKYI